jgi:TolB-like protein/cytochrome c-type biogenesis protein CcmH/NrfG
VFRYSRRALDLVWTTNRRLTVVLAILTLLAGMLPAAMAWIGALIIDAVVAATQVMQASGEASLQRVFSREQAAIESAVNQAASQAVTDKAAAAESDNSIAVLPFVNMSDDKSNEYFSDGLSEELMNLLAKIPQLRVIARTSSFAYKGTTTKIADVARELNVAHVLEGSVRKSGNQVRITAQLVRASDSSHLWSETYDRSLDDVFAIQDEISAAVVEQLKITLLGAAPKAKETDPAAYALTLQARQMQRQGTAEGYGQSISLYQQALAIAPDYAAAWAGLSESYGRQADKGLRPIAEGYTLAREAADKALAIDPDNAAAYAQLGWIAMSYDGDLSAAARYFERALQLDPANPDIVRRAATLTGNLGRMDEANVILKYAVSRDPVNSNNQFNLGLNYSSAGRWDEAIASLRTALSLSPGSIGAQSAIGDALLRQGKPDAALAAIQQESSEAFRLIGLAMAYHALGQVAQADAALAELINKHEQGWAYNIAYVLAYRGEADRTFEWLDKAVQYKDPGLSEIPTQIEFTNIHDDPRWLPFLESIGKSPAQLDAIKFKVTLPE